MLKLNLKRLSENCSKKADRNSLIIYPIGLLFTFLITLKEVNSNSYNNFQIFSFGSIDFWNNINPYSNWHHLSLKGSILDVYLYPPLFSILFTPFTFLPEWIGVFCWNIFTFSLFYLSIFTLPISFSFTNKKHLFFLSALLLFATLLSVQYNPIIAAIFLFSFTLFEKGKSFLAILLILISGFTKIYGVFQLIMLLFYPKFWKNIVYTLMISIVLLLLPLIKFSPNELIMYYQSWIDKITSLSEEVMRFYSIYRPVYLITETIVSYASLISLGILLSIFILTLFKLKLFKKSFLHRAQFLGILMSYTILFGLRSELHTYTIAIIGYLIWYLCSETTLLDKVLLWSNLILLEIFPIDIICPPIISNFILGKLNLGVIIFAITWGFMVYKTYSGKAENQQKIISLW